MSHICNTFLLCTRNLFFGKKMVNNLLYLGIAGFGSAIVFSNHLRFFNQLTMDIFVIDFKISNFDIS